MTVNSLLNDRVSTLPCTPNVLNPRKLNDELPKIIIERSKVSLPFNMFDGRECELDILVVVLDSKYSNEQEIISTTLIPIIRVSGIETKNS